MDRRSRARRMTRRGFKMMELLCSIAVIATLAAIGVPNFLEAQVRARVARTHQDMAALSAGLFAYQADWREWPASRPEVRDALLHFDTAPRLGPHTGPLPPEGRTASNAIASSGFDLHVLTSPVAYTSSILATDSSVSGTHGSHTGWMPYAYVRFEDWHPLLTPEQIRDHRQDWMLLSGGADDPLEGFGGFHPGNLLREPFIAYDPTNGTVSAGDIFMTAKGLSGP